MTLIEKFGIIITFHAKPMSSKLLAVCNTDFDRFSQQSRRTDFDETLVCSYIEPLEDFRDSELSSAISGQISGDSKLD